MVRAHTWTDQGVGNLQSLSSDDCLSPLLPHFTMAIHQDKAVNASLCVIIISIVVIHTELILFWSADKLSDQPFHSPLPSPLSVSPRELVSLKGPALEVKDCIE